MATQPFRIQVDQSVLDDLQGRLARTRWPDAVAGAGWQYGVSRDWLQQLAHYWQHTYDWRAQEAALNAFAHYRTEIDGQRLHFIHERGQGAHTVPILLLHGWPDSFYRFCKLIPLLTDPTQGGADGSLAFDVVVPSLPGFGFSDPTPAPDEVADTAHLLVRLMTKELGYTRFAVHGGDTGSPLAQEIARCYPEAVVAVHLTDIGYAATFGLDPATLSPAEQEYVAAVEGWSAAHGGYYMVQSTIPQTLAYGLTDSPIGLAAWILQHFWLWSDASRSPAADLSTSFPLDDLLTNIMIYWVTDTLNSSLRWYYSIGNSSWESDAEAGGGWAEADSAEGGWTEQSSAEANGTDQGSAEGSATVEGGAESDWAEQGSAEGDWSGGWETPRVEAPVAVALFPSDIPGSPAPRELAERTLNIARWTLMPRGGHFAALEAPDLLAADLHAFFRSLPRRP